MLSTNNLLNEYHKNPQKIFDKLQKYTKEDLFNINKDLLNELNFQEYQTTSKGLFIYNIMRTLYRLHKIKEDLGVIEKIPDEKRRINYKPKLQRIEPKLIKE